MIGKELSFLFELELAVRAALEPRRFSESSNSLLSCKTLVDGRRCVEGGGTVVGKPPAGRKLSGFVTVSIDIYQQEVGQMPLALVSRE